MTDEQIAMKAKATRIGIEIDTNPNPNITETDKNFYKAFILSARTPEQLDEAKKKWQAHSTNRAVSTENPRMRAFNQRNASKKGQQFYALGRQNSDMPRQHTHTTNLNDQKRKKSGFTTNTKFPPRKQSRVANISTSPPSTPLIVYGSDGFNTPSGTTTLQDYLNESKTTHTPHSSNLPSKPQ